MRATRLDLGIRPIGAAFAIGFGKRAPGILGAYQSPLSGGFPPFLPCGGGRGAAFQRYGSFQVLYRKVEGSRRQYGSLPCSRKAAENLGFRLFVLLFVNTRTWKRTVSTRVTNVTKPATRRHRRRSDLGGRTRTLLSELRRAVRVASDQWVRTHIRASGARIIPDGIGGRCCGEISRWHSAACRTIPPSRNRHKVVRCCQ